MWFIERQPRPEWKTAIEHLRGVDPIMGAMIGRVGPCRLAPRRDYFAALCQIVFTQQVSMAVAAVLFGRFRRLFPGGRPTSKALLALPDGQLATVGLSRQKRGYLLDLARRFNRGEIPTRGFARMNDEQVVQSLLPIKGIGRWSAEMFLIFILNRPDVLPVDDLGIRKAVQRFYGFDQMPSEEQVLQAGEKWRPWRTVATWYLWRAGAVRA